jgi:hypothetical protein
MMQGERGFHMAGETALAVLLTAFVMTQHRLQHQSIVVTCHAGRLRGASHFYNTEEDIEQLLAALP